MLPQCDYVAVTAPLTPETTGMIGKREFELMKPGAVILNVGRGPGDRRSRDDRGVADAAHPGQRGSGRFQC